LKSILHNSSLPQSSRDLIRALVLLWHDHLDQAHTISQGIENHDGSFVHAVIHRREPDYWDSKYWWRRVGSHLTFPEISRRVTALLRNKRAPDLLAKLMPRGQWDPFAFVDACEAASALPPANDHVNLLRAIQQIESDVALEYFVES